MLKVAWVLAVVWVVVGVVCYATGHTFSGYVHGLIGLAVVLFIIQAVTSGGSEHTNLNETLRRGGPPLDRGKKLK